MRADDEKKLLEPYVRALGELVVEWNDMTDSLGVLFAAILYPKEPMSKIALTVWHPTRSDLAQREMLRGAAKTRFPQVEQEPEPPKENKDISWLMDRANELSHKRNDAIHAPLTFQINDKGQPDSVVPSEFFGNLRAVSLGKKDDLLSEYEWYTATAEALKFFARQITATIQFQNRAWPDRPQLPSRGQKRS